MHEHITKSVIISENIFNWINRALVITSSIFLCRNHNHLIRLVNFCFKLTMESWFRKIRRFGGLLAFLSAGNESEEHPYGIKFLSVFKNKSWKSLDNSSDQMISYANRANGETSQYIILKVADTFKPCPFLLAYSMAKNTRRQWWYISRAHESAYCFFVFDIFI